MITALIDTYNHERFIAEAIESVLAQGFPASQMEILVVDDGSTDGTRARVEKFGERVRYLAKPNGGQASALNFGFQHARGEWIAMLDGDDVWLPHKLRRVFEELEKHPEAGIVFHPYEYWHGGEGIGDHDRTFSAVSGYLPELPEAMLRLGGVGTCSTVIRRDVAARVLPIPESLRVFADSYLLSTAIFCAPMCSVNECLTRYRQHGANLTAFTERDAARLRVSLASFEHAIRATEIWLANHGFDRSNAAADILLRRAALVACVSRFKLEPPSRWDFYRFHRDFHRLYGPLWSRGYRLYHSLFAAAAFALGYAGFEAAQKLYRSQSQLVALREFLVPVRNGKGGEPGRAETRAASAAGTHD